MTDNNQKKRMLISVDNDETRITLISGETLDNLYLEQNCKERIVGNIYRGVVIKIHTAFQAAFIDYGADRHGFLSITDVNFQLFKSSGHSRKRISIEDLLSVGQIIMVQVVKDEIGHKGATLTTNISLPGRFVVFMPNSDKGGVSRKIEDIEQRNRLKHLLEGLAGEDASAIIRTAGIDRSLSELKRDFIMLRRKWNQIRKEFTRSSEPGLINPEEDAVVRMLRDYFTECIEEIWIDEPEAFQRALKFFKASIPDKQKRLHLYLGDRSLFSAYNIEEQIEQLSSNRVHLKSGGSIVIDPTEALVAIDVNSGRSNQERSVEETAYRTNQEAAEEVARQLRLRNLGGLIVIDFIDMDDDRHRNSIIKKLEEHLSADKARWTIGDISQFGLLEMSRQRIDTSLSQGLNTICPTCGGSGSILSITSQANAILRQIRELAADGNVTQITSKVPIGLANHLLNNKRSQIQQLEFEFGISIQIVIDMSVPVGKMPALSAKKVIADEPSEEEIVRDYFKPNRDEKSRKSKQSRKRNRKPKNQREEDTEIDLIDRDFETTQEIEIIETEDSIEAEEKELEVSLELDENKAKSTNAKLTEENEIIQKAEEFETESSQKNEPEDYVYKDSEDNETTESSEDVKIAEEPEKEYQKLNGNGESLKKSESDTPEHIIEKDRNTLYSSVHYPSPQKDIFSNKIKATSKESTIPPGTILFSSVHRNKLNLKLSGNDISEKEKNSFSNLQTASSSLEDEDFNQSLESESSVISTENTQDLSSQIEDEEPIHDPPSDEDITEKTTYIYPQKPEEDILETVVEVHDTEIAEKPEDEITPTVLEKSEVEEDSLEETFVENNFEIKKEPEEAVTVITEKTEIEEIKLPDEMISQEIQSEVIDLEAEKEVKTEHIIQDSKESELNEEAPVDLEKNQLENSDKEKLEEIKEENNQEVSLLPEQEDANFKQVDIPESKETIFSGEVEGEKLEQNENIDTKVGDQKSKQEKIVDEEASNLSDTEKTIEEEEIKDTFYPYPELELEGQKKEEIQEDSNSKEETETQTVSKKTKKVTNSKLSKNQDELPDETIKAETIQGELSLEEVAEKDIGEDESEKTESKKNKTSTTRKTTKKTTPATTRRKTASSKKASTNEEKTDDKQTKARLSRAKSVTKKTVSTRKAKASETESKNNAVEPDKTNEGGKLPSSAPTQNQENS